MGASRNVTAATSATSRTERAARLAEKPGSAIARPITNVSATTAATRIAHHTAAARSFARANQWRATGSASRFLAVPSTYSRPKM